MRVAFFAPLKAPDHPVVSGDRTMARAFAGLLRDLGHKVDLASRLRLFDKEGDARRQQRLARLADWQRRRYLAAVEAGRRPRPDLWFTYHGYHKAPDLLGPAISEALDIPYMLVEASIAPKQAAGKWAAGHAASLTAVRRADGLLAMTSIDREGLGAVPGRRAKVDLFPPFLDPAPFMVSDKIEARAYWQKLTGLSSDCPRLLAVGMMRADVKRRSFLFLAEALGRLQASPWHLVIVGDGPARAEIEQAFATLCPGRVTFLGELERAVLPRLYVAADLLVWPAFAEAYGMVFLEAAAAGLPVIAGRHGGVADIVEDGATGLLVDGDAERFAFAVETLLRAPARRTLMGQAAQQRILERHTVEVAKRRLAAAMATAIARHRGQAGVIP